MQITEDMGEHFAWKDYAANFRFTPDTLSSFVNSLINDYEHDYGTIIHAMSAAAIAAIRTINYSYQGGITGFQAGCLMWSILHDYFDIGEKSRILNIEKMLYPQYENLFTSIDGDEWVFLQEKAKVLLESGDEISERVREHCQSILDGNIPFGYKLYREGE